MLIAYITIKFNIVIKINFVTATDKCFRINFFDLLLMLCLFNNKLFVNLSFDDLFKLFATLKFEKYVIKFEKRSNKRQKNKIRNIKITTTK